MSEVTTSLHASLQDSLSWVSSLGGSWQLLLEKRTVPWDVHFGFWVDLWAAERSQAIGLGFGLVGPRIPILQSKEQTGGRGLMEEVGREVPSPRLRPVLTREGEYTLRFLVRFLVPALSRN